MRNPTLGGVAEDAYDGFIGNFPFGPWSVPAFSLVSFAEDTIILPTAAGPEEAKKRWMSALRNACDSSVCVGVLYSGS